MPTPTTAKLWKPKSEDEFENIAVDFLRIRWKDPHVKRHGRRGQRQHGVDIYGHPPWLKGATAGAQCKNTDALSLAVVIAEVEEAKTFKGGLREFLMVTTGDRDATLQTRVHEHFRTNPVGFNVEIIFWEDITADLAADETLVAKHWKGFTPASVANPAGKTAEKSKPSPTARSVLRQCLDGKNSSLGPKLQILSRSDRDHVLESLISEAKKDVNATQALAEIIRSKALSPDERDELVQQLVKHVTLEGDSSAKAAVLDSIPLSQLEAVDESIRLALFEDVIAIVEADQFTEVNEIVAPLIKAQGAIPSTLHERYVLALLGQAESSSYRGAPAAQNGLTNLPDAFAAAGLRAMDARYLSLRYGRDTVKEFTNRYKHLADKSQRELLSDYRRLKFKEFLTKYDPDDDSDDHDF